MSFTAGDVSRYSPGTAPDLVISLHACDTATDIVLERAAVLGASNVLIRAYRPGGLVYKKKAEAKLSEYKNAYRYLCGKEAPPLSFENAE